jgi:hypothetical protein
MASSFLIILNSSLKIIRQLDAIQHMKLREQLNNPQLNQLYSMNYTLPLKRNIWSYGFKRASR